jgi:hypothetical protein
VAQVLAAAVLVEAAADAAGQDHRIEEGDVHQDADAAPDAAVAGHLQAAPGFQPEEVIAMTIFQAKVDGFVVLQVEIEPTDTAADDRGCFVERNLGGRAVAIHQEHATDQRGDQRQTFHHCRFPRIKTGDPN